MTCPRCRQDIPPGASLCPKCGASFGARDHRERPAAIEPILKAIARTAARLCDAHDALIFLAEADHLRLVAHHGPLPTTRTIGEPIPLDRTSVYGRALLDRRTIHVRDMKTAVRSQYPELKARQHTTGIRTMLAAPLLADGSGVGAIAIRRLHVRPFTPKQIALLKTFADQAAVALENARLSEELEARNRALTETLEQQTATSDILRVISSSPTNVQPVFDAIAHSAARLCEAFDTVVYRIDGKILRPVAHQGTSVAGPIPVIPGTVNGCAVIERRLVHGADLQAEVENFPEGAAIARQEGIRSFVCVPLLREGCAVGTIGVRRFELRPFSDKQIALLLTFADQAVIAIENVRLFKELEARNRDLTEALEQQTATAEVLTVISRSAFDLRPVLETLVENATRLCGAEWGVILRPEGDVYRMAVVYGGSPEFRDFLARNPIRSGRGSIVGRVALERRAVHIHDILADPEFAHLEHQRMGGYRTVLGVPMFREATLLGVFFICRNEVRPFTEKQIDLVTTFADQAVIAIENVRLFKELEARNRDVTEALDQQTATAEILRAISSSPTDFQPVFDTIVRNAARVCDAFDAVLALADGDDFVQGAHYGPIDTLGGRYPLRGTVGGRAVLERRVVQVENLPEAPEYPVGRDLARRIGYRTTLSVPLLREGAAIGAITIRRTELLPFSDKQIALLQTFADQAVIAIENVRLFKELEARNRDLTEALEQQTATAEILRAISSSPTDVQPVFDAIVESAARLCSAESAAVYRFEGEMAHFAAGYHFDPETTDAYRRDFPRPLRETDHLQRVLDGSVLNIADIASDPHSSKRVVEMYRFRGRSSVLVPMVREGRAIGAIGVTHREVGAFSGQRVELLKTFADQAVIAIENVRLFTELQARTRELARSVEELKALGEVGRAVSSTLDLQTVLSTIVSRAVELSGTTGGTLYEYDEASQEFHLRASHGLEEAMAEALRAAPLRLGEGVTGRAAALRAPVQLMDMVSEREYAVERITPIAERLGYRSVLSVPLLLEQRIMGGLAVFRKETGAFAPEVVNLLQTFAAQSSLSIQNARLFRELEDKGRQLEIASHHKSQFLANMSHELRTPLNAILGYTELLLDGIYGEVPEKAHDTMARIDRSGRHLLALINDVLDLSKIEAGQLTLALTDYSLKEVVQTVVTAMESLAAEKKIALNVSVAPDLPMGRGDDRRLSQVLLNLVGNALKFTDSGEVRVEARTTDGQFQVSVSDTGPGIAPGDQQRIFEEFQQADASNTRKKGGTGLGLSIARRILALHGGRIWVESAPGKGSTFSFSVPVRVERMVTAP